jgi:hypothetical protein
VNQIDIDVTSINPEHANALAVFRNSDLMTAFEAITDDAHAFDEGALHKEVQLASDTVSTLSTCFLGHLEILSGFLVAAVASGLEKPGHRPFGGISSKRIGRCRSGSLRAILVAPILTLLRQRLSLGCHGDEAIDKRYEIEKTLPTQSEFPSRVISVPKSLARLQPGFAAKLAKNVLFSGKNFWIERSWSSLLYLQAHSILIEADESSGRVVRVTYSGGEPVLL